MSLRRTIAAVGGAALLLAASAALAQQPGAPGRPGGFGRGQGGFGRGQGGFGRGQSSLARVPVETLTAMLHLSPGQAQAISKIQSDTRAQMQALRQPGAPPDPSTFQKFGQISQQANAQIEAQLNAHQKSLLPGVLKEVRAVQMARVPLQVLPQLHLTTTQVSQMEAIQQQAMASFQAGGQGMSREQRMSQFQQVRQQLDGVLTAQQKQIIAAYEQAHPRPNRGGRGGSGRPGAPGGGAA